MIITWRVYHRFSDIVPAEDCLDNPPQGTQASSPNKVIDHLREVYGDTADITLRVWPEDTVYVDALDQAIPLTGDE